MGFNNPDMPWWELERRSLVRCRAAAETGGPRGLRRGTPVATGRRGAASVSRTRRPMPTATKPLLRPDLPTVPYAELHCHSNFSFLDGASHPEQLAEEAARLGLEALAVTDHDGLYGVVRFAEAAQAVGLPTVFGAEITLTPTPGRCSARTTLTQQTVTSDGEHHLPRSARRAPARARRRAHRLRRAGPGDQPRPSGGGEGLRRSSRCTTCADAMAGKWWVLTGCRKGAVPAALVARRAARPRRKRAAAADRAVRPRPGGGGAVGSRRPARHGAQRCAGRAGGAPRRGLRRHQQRALRHAVAAQAGHGHRRGARPAQPRRARPVAAGGDRRPPAQRRRAGSPLPALPRRGRARRRDRPGRGVRPLAGRPEPAAVPVPDGADGTELTEMQYLRQLVERGCVAPLRRTPVAARGPVAAGQGVDDHRPRARRDRAARLPRLLPGGVGHRRVLQARQHLLPGSGQRGQQRGVLRARHHQGRCGVARPAVRAVPVARARRPARHRHRHRERPARRGHPVRVRSATAGTTPRRSPTSSPTGPGRRCATWPRRSATRPGQQDAWSKQIDAWGDVVDRRPTEPDHEHPRSSAGAGRRRSRMRRATSASTPAAWSSATAR